MMYDYLNNVDDGLAMRLAGPWAAVKLDYLRRYIDVFVTSMRNKWTYRNYIDLLSGPGKNRVRDTGAVLLGSPLLALQAKFPFTGYYFIDLEKSNTSVLNKRCSASNLSNLVNIRTGDCNKLVDQVVKKLKPTESGSLNLAFLDPEGMELHFDTIAKLASIKRMDLIINYPQSGLNRLMKNEYQTPDDNMVDLFFGTKEWRDIYSRYQEKRKKGIHRELIDLYKAKLHRLGYGEVIGSDEIGLEEPAIRHTKLNVTLYRLLFASKHELGEKFWSEVTKRDNYGQMRLLDSR